MHRSVGLPCIPIIEIDMVSILVPVYNTAPYLRQCVQSLTGQTYRDLQIVLIDDGSTDGSLDVLKELARDDKRIEIYNKANGGVASTRNLLIGKARGEWVLFVDSDDWIDPDTVECLLNAQSEGDYDIVSYKLSGESTDNKVVYNHDEIIKLFLEHTTFRGSLCDKLIRGSLFDGVFCDRSVGYGEDALIVWQVLQRVKSICLLDKTFYHYRVNMNSISRQSFNGKKFTAYTVWDTICRDVDEDMPQYRDIAYARFACEMTQILRAAALSGYKRDTSVEVLQEIVRRYGHLIRKTGISSSKMSLYAYLISRNYPLAKCLSRYTL